MTKIRPCRGPHPLLLLVEENSLGGVVRCLQCHDTLQMSLSTLEEEYLHALHVTSKGEEKSFFLHERIATDV